MHIVSLTREYPPDTHWGGCATVNYNLARALAQRGHKVQVICQAVGMPRCYMDQGVMVYRVGTNARRYSAIARFNFYFHAWRKLRDVTSQKGPDVIHADHWTAEALFPSLTHREALVVASYSTPDDAISTRNYAGLMQRLQLNVLGALADFTAGRADMIVSDSEANYRQMRSQLRIADDKIVIIRPGLDSDTFKFVASEIKMRLGVDESSPIVLSVGRLEPRKGIDVFLQALPWVVRSVPQVRFVMVGQDTNLGPGGMSMRQHVIAEAEAHGLRGRLIMLESVDLAELVQLYSACDVFVMASLRESFGLPVLEAMACGKPVVATATGIAPELRLDGINGVLVPVNNPRILAEAIIRCLALTPEQKEVVAMQNRRTIEREFSIPVWARQWEDVFRRAMNQRTHGKVSMCCGE